MSSRHNSQVKSMTYEASVSRISLGFKVLIIISHGKNITNHSCDDCMLINHIEWIRMTLLIWLRKIAFPSHDTSVSMEPEKCEYEKWGVFSSEYMAINFVVVSISICLKDLFLFLKNVFRAIFTIILLNICAVFYAKYFNNQLPKMQFRSCL